MLKYKYMYIEFIIFILLIKKKQKNDCDAMQDCILSKDYDYLNVKYMFIIKNVYVSNNHLLVWYAINRTLEFECIFGKNHIIDIEIARNTHIYIQHFFLHVKKNPSVIYATFIIQCGNILHTCFQCIEKENPNLFLEHDTKCIAIHVFLTFTGKSNNDIFLFWLIFGIWYITKPSLKLFNFSFNNIWCSDIPLQFANQNLGQCLSNVKAICGLKIDNEIKIKQCSYHTINVEIIIYNTIVNTIDNVMYNVYINTNCITCCKQMMVILYIRKLLFFN